jgi:multidrug resistance efflux pump
MRIMPFLITLVTTALAGLLGWAMWGVYMGTPRTRDATVRAYVVTMAPEVAGVSSNCTSSTTSSCTRATC